jgi:hypothetical protein
MPKLIVTHKGKFKGKYELYSDGQSIGLISNGETREIDVPEGEHTFEARMGNYRSKTLNYKMFSKDRKSILLYPNKISTFFLLIGLLNFCFLILILSGILKHKGPYSMLFFFILILSYYFLVVRRNNYIIIKEEGVE